MPVCGLDWSWASPPWLDRRYLDLKNFWLRIFYRGPVCCWLAVGFATSLSSKKGSPNPRRGS